MTVLKDTKRIRPYVVCAILRNMTFTPESYANFIDLQDKLHNNICRKRTLVAIGTHDLDTLQPPFVYKALPPTDINFIPLSQTRSFRGDELMEFYSTDITTRHIKPYVDIIVSSPVYPIIYDSKNTVLSLPPIINGEHSKITLNTQNVFIECTATDLTKANIVLNMMVTMFSEYCKEKFTVEAVETVYEEPVHAGTGGGDHQLSQYLTPEIASRYATVNVNEAASIIGIQLEAEQAANLCTRMGLEGKVIKDINTEGSDAVITATKRDNSTYLKVAVPPTRADVLHECDIIEDLAIAYGYNNIIRTIPKTSTVGEQLPINKLTDHLRRELAMAGYDETLTLALCSRQDNYENMLLNDDGKTAVILGNPQSDEFQIGRTAMVPGLLKALQCNRSSRIADGVKIFEISDVMLLDSNTDVGARNERHLGCLYTGPTAGFEIIHGVVDRIMQLLEVKVRPYVWEKIDTTLPTTYGRAGRRYYVEATNDIPTYFPGRGAQIILELDNGTKTKVGTFGVLHPKVLANFELNYPATVLELNIEPFLL